MKRSFVLFFLLLGSASAADLNLRPQGEALTRAVQQAIAEVSTPALPLRLVTSGSGVQLSLAATGSVPFNPDSVARTVGSGAARRIELNPAGPLPLQQAVRLVLAQELNLSAWTPDAARLRFSGADLNADGLIDLADLAILMNNLGSSGRGDLNGDRRVDEADIRVFEQQYQLP